MPLACLLLTGLSAARDPQATGQWGWGVGACGLVVVVGQGMESNRSECSQRPSGHRPGGVGGVGGVELGVVG